MRENAWISVLICVLACGSPAVTLPVTGADASADGVSASVAKKYDILWVIDHSASMAQHQHALTDAIPQFVKQIQAAGTLDVQSAVVTVQQIADSPSAVGATVKQIGAFRHEPVLNLPPTAVEQFVAPCYVDGPSGGTTPSEQCKVGFDFTFQAGTNYQLPATSLVHDGNVTLHFASLVAASDMSPTNEWRCNQVGNAGLVTNLNGSVNGGCWRHCATDKECQDVFGDPAFICYTPGGANGDPATAGCTLPPQTANCPSPDKLPPILPNNQLDLLRCTAAVGVSSSPQSGFEGGFRSAWSALDPQGPNCADANHCQNTQFIRADATLVLIFLSDSDDCSVVADKSLDDPNALDAWLPKEDWQVCQLLGDAAGGNVALNEARCRYLQAKDATPTTFPCPGDCAAGDAPCEQTAAANVAKNALVDARFATVEDYRLKFQTLKADPQQLIVAAISGDSPIVSYANGAQPAETAQVHVDRVMFEQAAMKDNWAKASPYICRSPTAPSQYGSRYLQLAAALGANGWAGNLCDDLGVTLGKFATFLATRP